jgi:hypothetical protein
MKTLICLLSLFTLHSSLFAGNVRLRWDANPEPDVSGYAIYERLSADSSRLLAKVDGKTLTTIVDLSGGKHTLFFVVLSEDGKIASPDSDPLTITVPSKGTGLRIESITLEVTIPIPPQQP